MQDRSNPSTNLVRLTIASMLLLLICAPAWAADAQMYRCQDGDDVTFSQEPCGDNAQTLDIEDSDGRQADRVFVCDIWAPLH